MNLKWPASLTNFIVRRIPSLPLIPRERRRWNLGLNLSTTEETGWVTVILTWVKTVLPTTLSTPLMKMKPLLRSVGTIIL